MNKVAVLGGNFAGITAAFDIKRKLGQDVDVVVISKSERFVFVPSLIWLTPGWRREEQITFPLKPAFERRGIRFVNAAADRVDVNCNTVLAGGREEKYDFLVVATGPYLNFKAVPGTGPEEGYTESVCNLPHAQHARSVWRDYLRKPGDVVIGAVQGASCLGAAYEVVLNQTHALEKAGIRDKIKVSFITPEPFVGHFGLGGIEGSEEALTKLLRKKGIDFYTNVAVQNIGPNSIALSNGKQLSYKYSMLIPPFLGVEAIRNSPGLGDEKGFIPINDFYQHKQIDNVYAAGVAVALAPPAPTPVPTGAPKTAYMSEVMARTAAHNIVSRIKKEKPSSLPILDIQAICLLAVR
jgi:sulfide:quinone oxidoreductase